MSQASKDLLFEEQARDKLLNGIEEAGKVVRVTLGPKGRNVGLSSNYGSPQITSDGHSILQDIELKDSSENMGVSIAKETAAKVKEKCGDGTTTTTLLLSSIVNSGCKHITAGSSPILLKRGMDQACKVICKTLDQQALEVKTEEEIENIATVSASGNREIGKTIAKAFDQAGRAGVITIEESQTIHTEIELVEGMRFDRGYTSPYFASNPETLTTEMDQPLILITDKKITSIHDIVDLLQAVAATNRELLIIADDIDGDALSTLVINRLRGTLKVAAVKAPGFGETKKAILEDLAVLTGAHLLSEATGDSLKNAKLEDLGSSDKVHITKDETTIVGGNGSSESLSARLQQIEAELKNTSSSYDSDKLNERRAKLSGGVAVIKVGAPSEAELKQLKQMYEDSLNSTLCAMEEGICIGGGMALINASQEISSLNLQGDEQIGAQIILEASKAPLRQIVSNSGENGSLILAELKGKDTSRFGFNALNQNIEDLFTSGVIDAVKVIKTSLQHANSAAGVILLTEALITQID